MTRPRHGTTVRCPRCALLPALCICAELVPRAIATKLVVLLLGAEVHKPTNTGRLAALLLAGTEVRVQEPRVPLRLDDLTGDPARRPLLLCETGNRVLDRELIAADPRPVTLIALDGTWTQARRFSTREPALRGIERVRVEGGGQTRYRLRDARHPGRFSTLEAIARALEPLEGPEVRAHLEAAFERFVTRSLEGRGVRVDSSPAGSCNGL